MIAYGSEEKRFALHVGGQSISMKAMILSKIVSLNEVDSPLELVDLPIPDPGPGEILVKVAACGVCHTEMDEIEGRIALPKLPLVLGHELSDGVELLGKGVSKFRTGDRCRNRLDPFLFRRPATKTSAASSERLDVTSMAVTPNT